jgi:hypothetical protein
MTMPPMIAVAIPIGMPAGGMLSKYVASGYPHRLHWASLLE